MTINDNENTIIDEMLVRGGVVLPMSSDGKLSTEKVAYYKVDVIASLFSLTVRRIQQLTQEGILPTVEAAGGRRYDLVPTIQRYVKYLSDKAYGKSHSEAENELKREKLEKEIQLKELQGEYRAIQNAIASGKYIGIEKVESDYRRFFTVLKKFLLGVPAKLSTRLTSVCDDPVELRAIESELNQDIITLLNNFVVAGNSEQIEEGAESVGKKAANAKNKKVHRA